MNPEDPTGSTYIVLPDIARFPAPIEGVHISNFAQSLDSWNWGAAFLTLPWSVRYRIFPYLVFIGLFDIAIIFEAMERIISSSQANSPMNYTIGAYLLLWLPIRIYFGVKGNKILWKFDRFQSVELLNEEQIRWKTWGIAAAIFSVISLIVVLAMWSEIFS